MRTVPGSDPTQMITKNLQRLGRPERPSADLPSQNPTVTAIQSPSVTSTAACGSSTRTKVSVNLVPGLAYVDLVGDELLASMNDGMMYPMGVTLSVVFHKRIDIVSTSYQYIQQYGSKVLIPSIPK